MKSLVCNPPATRFEAIRQYQILDTGSEQAFDDLVFLAAQICDTPIACIIERRGARPCAPKDHSTTP